MVNSKERNANQLYIGKRCEDILGCLFIILAENYVNHKDQDVVDIYRQYLGDKSTNAQFRLAFEDNASVMEEIYNELI